MNGERVIFKKEEEVLQITNLGGKEVILGDIL